MEEHGTARQATCQYNASHALCMVCNSFHGNNGYANAPQYYKYIDCLAVSSDVTLSRTQVLKAQVHPIYLRASCAFGLDVSIIRHMEIGFH